MSGFDSAFGSEVREVGCVELTTDVVERRHWSREQKALIVAETMAPGAVASAVARRHGLRPQQVFAWRHEAKQGRLALPAEATALAETVGFVPVAALDGPPRAAGAPIEIVCGALVVRVPTGVDAAHLTLVLGAVKAVA